MLETTRTHTVKLANHSQVANELDQCGYAASKLWNVGRYYIDQQYNLHDYTPDESELKRELKNHERYTDLHSQSSQQVLEELAGAFDTFFDSSDSNDNPPGYRKSGDEHPRSTVTWKQNGFKHDEKHDKLRLSKGSNLKEHQSDFILCEYQTRPEVEINNIQQVRAVYTNNQWELHIVCNKTIETEQSGEKTAGIDLGINNYLAISYETGETALYPGNRLKQDKHYFTRQEYDTEGEKGPSEQASWARDKLAKRKDHFLHSLAKEIVEECISNDVGEIAIGDLGGVREDEDGESKNWGSGGNKKLHGWEFGRFTRLLEYKAEEVGILVSRESERDTSKSCCACGVCDGSNRVERGLYVCSECGLTVNADVNGAENLRLKITQNPRNGDMSNGRLARPQVCVFDLTAGVFKAN